MMRDTLKLPVIAVCAMALVACGKPAEKQQYATPTTQLPTATEVFNLRSRCAELGDKLLDEARAGIGPALYADAKSHYEPKTNRCYVEVDVSTADVSSPNWKTTQRLYDGQTKEMLAWFETKGPTATDDKCAEYLNMPIGRSCRQVNEKILEIMSDNRQQ